MTCREKVLQAGQIPAKHGEESHLYLGPNYYSGRTNHRTIQDGYIDVTVSKA